MLLTVRILSNQPTKAAIKMVPVDDANQPAGRAAWIPRSLVDNDHDLGTGGIEEVSLRSWKVEELQDTHGWPV